MSFPRVVAGQHDSHSRGLEGLFGSLLPDLGARHAVAVAVDESLPIRAGGGGGQLGKMAIRAEGGTEMKRRSLFAGRLLFAGRFIVCG